jgi:predicted DNA-binding transcriptional regulator YafY
MLRLLSLLQTHRFWSGSDLADRLDVSERTVRRDVDRLRELGYPVEATRGVAGGYQLQAGAALPPLLLDDDEAVAIAVSLRTSAGGVVAGIEESSVSALSKLVQVMPPKLRRQMDALQDYTVPAVLSGPTIDAEALVTLARACRDDERIRFDYRTYEGAEMLRTVEPHRLVSLGRRWYLVGWDLDRHDWRSYRVDRLTDPHLTGFRFRQRDLPADDAAAFVQQGIASAHQLTDVTVRVAASADEVRRHTGRWADVTSIDEQHCLLEMKVDTFNWPAMLLGAIDADFDVLRPPELGDHLRAIGDRFRTSARAPGD